jgi:hypothetical protein
MTTPRKTKTKKSSSRTQAQRAGQSDEVLPGRRGKAQASPVIDNENEQVFGVLLSERRRMGDGIPTVPESKTKNTQSREPRKPK